MAVKKKAQLFYCKRLLVFIIKVGAGDISQLKNITAPPPLVEMGQKGRGQGGEKQ
jgi:hypothetical protein